MMMESRIFVAGAIAVTVVGLWFQRGCQSSSDDGFSDPVRAMTDSSLNTYARERAMRQAAAELPDNPDRIRNLKEIMSGRSGDPPSMRINAFKMLLAHDEQDAQTTVYFRLPTIPSPELKAYLCEYAANAQWVEMTPSLIRSLSVGRPQKSYEETPEARALLQLHPGKTLKQIVFEEVKVQRMNLVGERWRLAAWEFLFHLGESRDTIARWLQSEDAMASAEGDTFVDDLRNGYEELSVIPETVEEVRWLRALRQPEYDAWWSRCRAAVEAIPEVYRSALGLRHLTVMVWMTEYRPEWLRESKSEMLRDLRARIGDRRHYFSGLMSGGANNPMYPQELDDWADSLSWADVVSVRLAESLAFDQSIRDELFRQAEQDRLDDSTEYGGLLTIDPEGRAKLMPFDPERIGRDDQFHATTKMLRAGYTQLFHYHFHAQEIDQRDYAGPGSGDLNYAEMMRVNAIVFTSVGENQLNVDFYQEGQVAIDLGVINR